MSNPLPKLRIIRCGRLKFAVSADGAAALRRGLGRGEIREREGNAIESFLLALVAAGVDVSNARFSNALDVTLDALAARE